MSFVLFVGTFLSALISSIFLPNFNRSSSFETNPANVSASESSALGSHEFAREPLLSQRLTRKLVLILGKLRIGNR